MKQHTSDDDVLGFGDESTRRQNPEEQHHPPHHRKKTHNILLNYSAREM
jgi:hypothetical protein